MENPEEFLEAEEKTFTLDLNQAAMVYGFMLAAIPGMEAAERAELPARDRSHYEVGASVYRTLFEDIQAFVIEGLGPEMAARLLDELKKRNEF